MISLKLALSTLTFSMQKLETVDLQLKVSQCMLLIYRTSVDGFFMAVEV